MVVVSGGVREVAPPAINRASANGVSSIDDVKATVLRQQPVWWRGKSFHCAARGLDFVSSIAAAAPTVNERHPGLRMD
jgi:hypothetical protein